MPDNELGTGVLDPQYETWLIARGFVYARRRSFVNGRGQTCIYIECSKRPIVEVYTDLLNNRIPTRSQPQTGRHDPAQADDSGRLVPAGQRAQPEAKNPG